MIRLVIAALALALAGMIVANNPQVQAFLMAWQTMLTGFIAIGAALIGGYYVQAQSALVDGHEQDRIRRQFEAERALLPLTLSKMSAYARASGRAIRAMYPAGEAVNFNPDAELPNFPDPPTEEVQHLAAVIRASQDAKIREVVAELLSRLQVQSARMLDLRDMREWHEVRRVMRTELDEYLLNAADIYARCAGLFDYARRETTIAPGNPTYGDLSSALNQMGLRNFQFPGVHERLQRYYGAVPSPAAGTEIAQTQN